MRETQFNELSFRDARCAIASGLYGSRMNAISLNVVQIGDECRGASVRRPESGYSKSPGIAQLGRCDRLDRYISIARQAHRCDSPQSVRRFSTMLKVDNRMALSLRQVFW